MHFCTNHTKLDIDTHRHTLRVESRFEMSYIVKCILRIFCVDNPADDSFCIHLSCLSAILSCFVAMVMKLLYLLAVLLLARPAMVTSYHLEASCFEYLLPLLCSSALTNPPSPPSHTHTHHHHHHHQHTHTGTK